MHTMPTDIHLERHSTAVRRSSALALLCCSLLVVGLWFAADRAFGAQVRLLSASFGAGTSTPANPYPLAEHNAAGIAVDDASHDVYVADETNHRVEKFDSSGHFLLMFGKEVNKTKSEEVGSTEAERNVCTAASGDTCQAGVRASSPGAFFTSVDSEGALYLAVDNSGGPSKSDVYVADGGDNLVTKFDESGHVISSWASGGQLNGSSAKDGPFGPLPLAGIVVDPSGNLWVANFFQPAGLARQIRLFEFKQDATFMVDWASGPGIVGFGETGIAVDSQDNLYLTSGTTAKFDSAGKEIGVVTPTMTGPSGVAVDPSSDDLYVDAAHLGAIQRYDSSCHPTPGTPCTPAESFGSGHLSGAGNLAIDASAAGLPVYALENSGRVAAFSVRTVPDVVTQKPTVTGPTTATLTGTVNPAGIELNAGTNGCRFEWGETTEPYEHIAPCDKSSAQIGKGESPVEVHASIPLQAGHSYHYRLVAANKNDVNEVLNEPRLGQDRRLGPPLIDSTSVADVSSESVTLQAGIDPQNVAGAYRFEYLTEAEFLEDGEGFAGARQAPLEPASLGSGEGDAEVSQHVQGLEPHTAYRYRVVAESALAQGPAATVGPTRAFTTQIAAPFALPDARAWEQVSPIDKRGATIFPIGLEEGPIQASPDGGALTYPASAPTEAQPQGSDADTQVLSARAPAGWSSRDLNIPHPEGAGLGVGIGREYRFFSADLSRSLVHPYGPFDQLSPQATEQTPYLRTDFPPGQPTAFCAESCYRPLVTAAEGFADVPPGTKFGEEGQCPPHPHCGPTAEFATADLSHVLLKSESGALTVGGTGGSLYEWSAGAAPAEALRLVSVLPGGEAALQQVEPNPGGGARTGARNAVSADGSRVFWSENGSSHLYLRENATEEPSHISGTNVDGSQCTEAAKACTVQLDAVQGGSGAGVPSAHFQLATADGSRVFFTDTQRLTPGSGGESHGGGDLYEYDLERPAGERLADLTPESGGEAAGVQKNVAGASADGSYVYFVAGAALTGGNEENSAGEKAIAGEDNLYLYHEGEPTFIATLSGADRNDFAAESLLALTARVSPNGRFFAFMSQRPLTGYDNRDAVSGKPDQEVYLYRAGEGGEEGKLICASCNPTGARPHGVEAAAIDTEGGGLAGGDFHVWQGTTWLAANVPGWTPFSSGGQTPIAIYQSRYLSDSGRLFFNSSDALVPSDSNGTEDVYEYEPPGIGSCTEGSPSFGEASGGCVGLISSGTSAGESAFLDASENGNDVFFLTYAKLTSTDPDSSLDVYDARAPHVPGEAVGFPEAPKPVECVGDGCQPPAVAPSDPTPGSLSFHGPGNVHEEAPAKKRKKHAKKKHRARHKRAGHSRGGRR